MDIDFIDDVDGLFSIVTLPEQFLGSQADPSYPKKLFWAQLLIDAVEDICAPIKHQKNVRNRSTEHLIAHQEICGS